MSGYRREPNWYMTDGTYNRLSRAAMLTLAHLARLVEGGTWAGSVSTTRLVELTGLGRSSVARALNELREVGIIERETGDHSYRLLDRARPTGGTSDVPQTGHQRPTAGTDCPTHGTPSAPQVGHERPTDGTCAPHGWDSHPYRPKTLLQEHSSKNAGEREKDQNEQGNQTEQTKPDRAARNAQTAADIERGKPAAEFDPTVSSRYWHAQRANGSAPAKLPAKIPSGYGELTAIEAGRTILNAVGWPEVRRQGNLGATRLGELAFALMRTGDEDPVATIGERMHARVTLERKSKDGDLSFLPKVTNWIEEEFCDVLAGVVA